MRLSVVRADRKHMQGNGSDQRSPFQRDRDRLLYCQEFRRLAGITQAAHSGEGHVFHNRLTHTLKVAQIGRRLAEHLGSITDRELLERAGGLDADVVETACLAHDIGHPPFGHAAEGELDRLLKDEYGIPDGFEGNAQTFRTVARVAMRSVEHPGLDLTRASLNAIIKYPWPRGTTGKASKKWGYYSSEEDDFQFARQSSAGKTQSLEAAIMDWADDIAYSVHDVDDFYRAGIIPLDLLLRSDSGEREQFLKAVSQREDWVSDHAAVTSWGGDFFDALNSLAATRELHLPFRGTPAQHGALNRFTSLSISRYLGVEQPNSVSVSPSTSGGPLNKAPQLEREVQLLKAMMRYYVFEDQALVAQQHGQRQVIGNIFQVLYKATAKESTNHQIVPYRFRPDVERVHRDAKSEEAKTLRARVVADIVSTMTEQQALSLHARLSGTSSGSIFERILR